jgi:prepilin-type N-terminal cleavage/methylation domain-containing protein
MRKMGTRLIHKGQRGFTLIELLIAIALSTLIAGAIVGAIFQVFTINTRSTNRMTAVREVQNAGFWVSPDVQMAENVTVGGGPNPFLTLTWIDWDGVGHNVTYRLVDMSGGLKRLQREHYKNSALDSTTTVAEYISYPTGTSCIHDGRKLTFTVTANVGAESQTRVYVIEQRVGS